MKKIKELTKEEILTEILKAVKILLFAIGFIIPLIVYIAFKKDKK